MHLKHERIWVANGGGIIMFYWSEKHDFVNVGKSGNISNFILEWGQTRKYASNSIENCSSSIISRIWCSLRIYFKTSYIIITFIDTAKA